MRYQCNICGGWNDTPPERLDRETPDCTGCGSTLRTRSVIGLLSQGLFGSTMPIDAFPRRRDLRGIGMSDSDAYATRLARRLDYTNTYFHQEPRLDITQVPVQWEHSCDFLISSDVFEHVVPPVARAFEGAKRLLKPGGLLILTVPYRTEDAQTLEHFPHLHEFSVFEDPDSGWRLRNRRADGFEEEFGDLIFHGGPGSTLEMRLFARDALLQDLRDAGFSQVRIADEAMPEIGVVWPVTWSLPVVARA